MRKMSEIMEKLHEEPPKVMAGRHVVEIRDYTNGIDGLPRSNVMSLRDASGAKVIIRPSGTEPKMKAYLSATGWDVLAVESALDALAAQVREWLT